VSVGSLSAMKVKSPRIKICCIGSVEEAKTAIQFGASAIGLVGNMPSGPGIISDDLICKIAKSVPPPIGTFLLTSETSPEKIIAQHRCTATNTIQIVDAVAPQAYAVLREALPSVKLVQVIHVINEKSVEEAIKISEFVDAILLDSGNPNLKIKELGGTGRVHNWKFSRQIRDHVQIPVFLAGGLNPDNVYEAIEAVKPFGVDVCSGVRTNGKLDEGKLELFMRNCE
jgi:phosphoribosylanthranilate isomerase